MSKKKIKNIPISDILDAVVKHFRMVDQWAAFKDYARTHSYSERAEALIEMVEVQVCGSFGGFDSGQEKYTAPLNTYTYVSDKLWDRYMWLRTKYGG